MSGLLEKLFRKKHYTYRPVGCMIPIGYEIIDRRTSQVTASCDTRRKPGRW
jgi:uncharacterized Fe-S cluster-containing protein